MLITRDLSTIEPADDREVDNEQLVYAGSPNHVRSTNFAIVRSMPILNITSRPDILPTWLRAMNLTFAGVKSGARYNHNYPALPADNGKMPSGGARNCCQRLGRRRRSARGAGITTCSGMQYRAYAVDRSDNSEISRAFCRWLVRLCKKAALLEAA